MSILEKQCSKCAQVLPAQMFSKNGRGGLRNQCKTCCSNAHSSWLLNGGSDKKKQYCADNPIIVQTAHMIVNARRRAKKKNLPFDIDQDYLRSIVPSFCPVLGISLEWSARRAPKNQSTPLPNSPSLDRIDPERGYVKGNAWIISHRANTIKSDATHEELKLVTKAVGKAIVDSLEF